MKITTKLLQHAFPILVIGALGFGLYANTLFGEFQFDDYGFIKNNPAIYHLNNFGAIQKFYSTRIVVFYTFALNYALHGFDVFGYHLINTFIHVLNALFVRWLVLLILETPRLMTWKNQKRKDVLALFTALIFLVHPLQTQAVSYISQRMASLAVFFYLLALIFYLKGRAQKVSGNGKGYYLAACLSAALGMFTKEIVFTLPVVCFLVEMSFFEASSRKKIKSKMIWLLGFLLIIPLIYSFDFSHIFLRSFDSRSHPGEIIVWSNYLLTQFRVIVIYIKLLFVPLAQNFDYDFTLSQTLWNVPTFLSFLAICLLVNLAVVIRKKSVLVAFGIGWFFVTLLVESSIIPIPHVIFEHRVYLPSIGFSMALVFGLYALMKNYRLFCVVLSVTIVMYSFLTIQRNNVWQRATNFWEDVIKKSPRKARGYNNLASALLREGRIQEALPHLHTALKLNANETAIYNNLTSAYIDVGNFSEAEKFALEALKLNVLSIEALNNLGVVYVKRGEKDKGRKLFLRATAIKAETAYEAPALNLARLYQEQGEVDKAINIYHHALRLFPHIEGIYYTLADIYFKKGDTVNAEKIGNQILKNVRNEIVLVSAGGLFAQNENVILAYAMYAKAFKRNDDYKAVYLEWGKLLGNLEDFDGAIALWKEGQRRFPGETQFQVLIDKAGSLTKDQL